MGAGATIHLSGTINASSQYVYGGTLCTVSGTKTFSSGIQVSVGGRKAYQTSLTTEANTLTSYFSGQHRLLYIRLFGSNYDYRCLLGVDQQGYGGAGAVGVIINYQAINGAAYGAPTFTVDVSGNWIVTNSSYPSTGITAYWAEQCVSFGTETLKTIQF